jgi:hypothetical protein
MPSRGLNIKDAGRPGRQQAPPKLDLGNAEDLKKQITPDKVVISRDGKYAAAYSKETKEVKVWEVESEKAILFFTAASDITALAFSPVYPQMLALGSRGGVTLYDVENKTELGKATFLDGKAVLGSLTFSEDGKRLVAGIGGNRIGAQKVGMVWTVTPADGGKKFTLENPIEMRSPDKDLQLQVYSLVMSRVGENPDIFGATGDLIEWSYNKEANAYLGTKVRQPATFPFDYASTAIAISPKNARIATGDLGGWIYVHNLTLFGATDSKFWAQLPKDDKEAKVVDLGFTDEDNIWVVGGDGKVRNMVIKDGKLVEGVIWKQEDFKNNMGTISFALSRDKLWTAAGGKNKTVVINNRKTGELAVKTLK